MLDIIAIVLCTGIVLLLVLVLLCVYYNHTLTVEEYGIEDAAIPKSFWEKKIVMLSDLHEHQFGVNNSVLVARIKELSPDYIMIAGDLLIKGEHVNADAVLPLLEQLVSICPVYYAPGNHEEKLERVCRVEYMEYLTRVKAIGVHYLANESLYIQEGQERIRVSGLHLQKKYFARFYQRVDLKLQVLEELLEKNEEEYEVLIAHNPEYFSEYTKWGANLVLAGHVHGGIVILPWLGGVISTSFALFPKFDFGLFREGNAIMVLSRGLGAHTIKLRLFNKPEISLLRLNERYACEKKRKKVE